MTAPLNKMNVNWEAWAKVFDDPKAVKTLQKKQVSKVLNTE